jgi:hypothetical protein
MGQEYHIIHGAHKFSIICGFFERGVCVCVCVCVSIYICIFIYLFIIYIYSPNVFWGSKFCAFFQPQNCNFYIYIKGFFVWGGGGRNGPN